MNAILGGQFSSRINLNLREEKGYSYGARSHFAFRLGPGPFEAGGVGADRRDQGGAGRADQGADRHHRHPARHRRRAGLRQGPDHPGLPQPSSRRPSASPARSPSLVLYDLPDDYFTTYPAKVEAVTKADVDRVARKYLDPDQMTILVVGDRAKVEARLKSLPFAKVINVLDPDGNPLPPAAAGTEESSR